MSTFETAIAHGQMTALGIGGAAGAGKPNRYHTSGEDILTLSLQMQMQFEMQYKKQPYCVLSHQWVHSLAVCLFLMGSSYNPPHLLRWGTSYAIHY